MADPAPRLRVGDLAKITDVTVRTLHHYEQLGLLEPVARSKGQYRLYDADSVARIRWIHKLKSLGLSLGEIQQLVHNRNASASAHRAARALRTTYEERLSEVRQRLGELAALERELEQSLRYLESCNTECAPALVPTDCAHCARHTAWQDIDLINGALI